MTQDAHYHRIDAGRRRGRRYETIALVLLGVLLVAAACTGTTADRNVKATMSHRVTAGESLWVLAEGVQQTGETTEQAMERIAALNGLKSGALVAGTTIELPVDTSFDAAQAMR